MISYLMLVIGFLVNPVFLVSLLVTIWYSFNRVKLERKQFSIAINPKHPEIRIFLVSGLFAGIILSVISFLSQTIIAPGELIIYSWMIIILVLFSVFGFFPSFLPFYILMFLGIFALSDKLDNSNPVGIMSFVALADFNQRMIMFYALAITILFLLIWLLTRELNDASRVIVNPTKRGRQILTVKSWTLTLIPLLLFIPDVTDFELINVLPSFEINGSTYHLILFPLVFGFSFIFKNQLPNDALDKLRLTYGTNLALSIILAITIYCIPDFTFMALIISSVVYLISLVVILIIARSGKTPMITSPKYLVVMGAKSDTPAERLGLEVGDQIVEVNDVPVNDHNSFYQAVQMEPTYVRMRVKDRFDEFKIVETAIFQDSPHELGIMFVTE